jgi:heat shock protein HtpX
MKTFLFLGILTGLFMLIGYSFGGSGGMIFALIFAFGLNFFSYWYSDTLILKMYGAKQADPIANKDLYDMTKELTKRGNLPMPKLYVMENPAPNAFATGRNPNHCAVAITTGLYNILSKEELSGVIAHELAHIKHYDTLLGTAVATIAGAISMLANMFMFANMFGGNRDNNQPHPIVAIALMILAPLVASIIQMSISRQREYLADKEGGSMCKNPLYLASALQKLEDFHTQNTKTGYNTKAQKQSRYNDNYEDDYAGNHKGSKQPTPATAHLFIINPLNGSNRDNLFSTHPNTKNRIAKLISQANSMGIDNFYAKPKQTEYKSENLEKIFDRNNPWL